MSFVDPSDIANTVEIAAVDTAVIKPFPFTVITGIAVVLPKDPTFELTVSKVVFNVILPEPSNAVALASTSPAIVIFLAVANVVAVEAFPTTSPVNPVADVTLPLTFKASTICIADESVDVISFTSKLFTTTLPVPCGVILISALDDPVVISLSAIVIALPVVTNDPDVVAPVTVTPPDVVSNFLLLS